MRDNIKNTMLKLKAELIDNHVPCEGTGWLPPEKPGQIHPCECMTIFHYLNALIEAKIPRDYWWLKTSDLEIDAGYIKFCEWFSKRLHSAVPHALGALFLGPNGIGKTSMQCAIGKEAIVQGYTVQYFTAQQYVDSRKVGNDDLTKEYESGQVILLDEMDKVYIKSRSNYVTKTLEDFLRRKTADGTSFIICTNHDQDTLEEVFGQSTMSMLRRHLKFIDVEGQDYSLVLQDRWDTLMKVNTDYYADAITEMAHKLMERELSEDVDDWE